jgi:REP element-mobilizing transposase RayT
MPRQARLDYPGALHHVIGRGIDGLYIFNELRDKREFLHRIKKRLDESSLQIYGWCLMGNHFHLLIQTGKTPLAEFMRSIMTGYAIYYNKSHKRKGYLFQNRYKSILCEADGYLLKLISYVHLNPIKARIVSLGKLKQYAWTGHKELMSQQQEEGLIDREEVLGFFGLTEKQAIETYMAYLKEELKSSEDMNGGGLVCNLVIKEEKSKVQGDEKQMYDKRILGSRDFVERVLNRLEAEELPIGPFKDIIDLLTRLACYYQLDKEEILNSRTKEVREARHVFVYLGNIYLSESLTALGELLRINQSAASQARQKGQQVTSEKGLVKKLAKIKY